MYEEAAQELIDRYADGEVVPMEFLRHILQVPDPDFSVVEYLKEPKRSEAIQEITRKHAFAWMEAVDGLRRELLETHQVALKNVRGRGYLRVVPRDQTALAMRELHIDTARAIKKTYSLLTCIRLDLLDIQERLERDTAISKMDQLRRLQRKVLT